MPGLELSLGIQRLAHGLDCEKRASTWELNVSSVTLSFVKTVMRLGTKPSFCSELNPMSLLIALVIVGKAPLRRSHNLPDTILTGLCLSLYSLLGSSF